MDLDGLLQRTRHLTAPPAHISLVRTAADNVPPRILRVRSSENWGKLNRVPSGCFSYKAIDKPHSQMFYAMILSSVCLSVCLFVCCLKCIHKNAVFSKKQANYSYGLSRRPTGRTTWAFQRTHSFGPLR